MLPMIFLFIGSRINVFVYLSWYLFTFTDAIIIKTDRKIGQRI